MPAEQRSSSGNSISKVLWAILRTGGKQYRVHIGDVLAIERSDFLRASTRDRGGKQILSFEHPLALQTSDGIILDPAELADAHVSAELLGEFRGEKVTVIKKRRRHNSRRKQGHRQNLFKIRILDILLPQKEEDASKEGDVQAMPLVPVTGKRTAHDDLIAAIASLREEHRDETTVTWLKRIAGTDWSQTPAWTRKDIARGIERHLNDVSLPVRGHAAAALDQVLRGGKVGDKPDWGEISASLTSYLGERRKLMLEMMVSPTEIVTDSGIRYEARVRIRRRLKLPGGNLVQLPTEGLDASDVILQVKGVGVVPGTFRSQPARELPASLAADWTISFVNRDDDDKVALIDVLANGRRIDRRFLNLETYEVTRSDPSPVEDAGGARASA